MICPSRPTQVWVHVPWPGARFLGWSGTDGLWGTAMVSALRCLQRVTPRFTTVCLGPLAGAVVWHQPVCVGNLIQPVPWCCLFGIKCLWGPLASPIGWRRLRTLRAGTRMFVLKKQHGGARNWRVNGPDPFVSGRPMRHWRGVSAALTSAAQRKPLGHFGHLPVSSLNTTHSLWRSTPRGLMWASHSNGRFARMCTPHPCRRSKSNGGTV